ncbi:MAG: DegT/DnrJ/EryC1/StrS family aminotransferase [Bacteroidia bacterium]
MQTWGQEEIALAKQEFSNPGKNRMDLTLEFASKFSTWQGVNNSFMFQNGRSALSFILDLLQLKNKDEVIISPYSCVVVYNSVLFSNAKPILCDIELDSLSLNYSDLKSKITSKTKAVVIPHLMGYVARDLIAIKELCAKQGICLIEDCAQSQGAKYLGKKVGNWADASFFSFEYSKVMSTINGGAAVLNSIDLIEKANKKYFDLPITQKDYNRKVISLGLSKYYRFKAKKLLPVKIQDRSFKSTLKEEIDHNKPKVYGHVMHSSFAEIGLIQLMKVDYYLEKRGAIANKLELKFGDKINFLKPIENSTPAFLRLTGHVPKDQKVSRKFNFNNLEVGFWYSSLLDPASVYLSGFENSKSACSTIINLPTL